MKELYKPVYVTFSRRGFGALKIPKVTQIKNPSIIAR